MAEERENSMSKWMQASNNSDISNKNSIFSQNLSKIERLKILESLNLPIGEYLYLAPEEVNRENKEFTDFVNNLTTILIIAIPFDQSLSKKYQIIPSEIPPIESFLEGITLDKKEYSILIRDRSIKPIYSGIIISNENKLVIELSHESLDKLLDGKVIPFTYLLEHISGNEMLTKEDAEMSEIINIVKSLIKSPEGFIKGYFEFIVEPSKGIKFWEYKNDPKYTRL